MDAITARFGSIDVLEYAPAGPEWLQQQTGIRTADPDSFEFGLEMLLRARPGWSGWCCRRCSTLADTGGYAGLVQVAGMVGGSESADHVAREWDPSLLPEPMDPADLAEAAWDLYAKRDRFEATVGPPSWPLMIFEWQDRTP